MSGMNPYGLREGELSSGVISSYYFENYLIVYIFLIV